MRIVHVIESLDPKHGGPPEVAACLAAAQAALGHDVAVASVDSVDDRKLTAHVPGFAKVRRISTPAPRGPARGMFDWSLASALVPALEGHDFVHLHNVWDSLLPQAARAARRLGVPYVLTPHGMLDTWSLAQHALRKKIAMATTHRALLRRATAIHCLNDHEAQSIDRLKLGPKTVIVANGLWLERVDAPRVAGAFRRSRPELGDDPFLLFLSRIHHKKGLDYLLDGFDRIAAAHPAVRLVIAGPDGGELVSVRERIARSVAPNRVHVVGPIYGDEKFAALCETACFVLPSRQEGFPIAVLEALGSGAPVVISRECHVDDAATSGAGFVVALDAAEIAEAMSRVLSTPNARETFGIAGRKLVETRYTWQRIATASIAMYESLTTR